MEIAAIYENGMIRPTQLLRLKHNIVKVTLVVPDEEIESTLVKNLDPLNKVKDKSIKQMIISMRNIRGTKTNSVNHGLTDNELFVEGLKKSGKYRL
jgi:predicted DNA-binding antitoxin AbrB/MazE fold protein